MTTQPLLTRADSRLYARLPVIPSKLSVAIKLVLHKQHAAHVCGHFDNLCRQKACFRTLHALLSLRAKKSIVGLDAIRNQSCQPVIIPCQQVYAQRGESKRPTVQRRAPFYLSRLETSVYAGMCRANRSMLPCLGEQGRNKPGETTYCSLLQRITRRNISH